MATDAKKTAYVVHANSYSIVGVIAGLITAIAIFAVLLFINYDRKNHFDAAPTTLTNAPKTGDGPN